MAPWIIGCTTRPYNALDYSAAFDHIAAAGYKHVALFAHNGILPIRCDSSDGEVRQVRQTAANAGLNPSMVLGRTHLDLAIEKAITNYKKLIDNTASVGARWLLELGTGNEELYGKYFELMSQVAPYAGEVGVEITMKPHGGISLTTDDLRSAVARVDHPAFSISYDPGNIIYYTGGKRLPGQDISTIVDCVSTLIIKDCEIVEGKPDVLITPGEGLVDFSLVWSKLRSGGFSGPAYVECVGPGSLEEIDRHLVSTLGFVKALINNSDRADLLDR